MQLPTSHDAYHITFSKWKAWSYAIVLWIIACFPLFVILILTEELLTDKANIESSIIIGLAFFSLLFLFFAGVPFVMLTKLKRPLATINRHGFSAWKKSKIHNYPWTPTTVMTGGLKGMAILANLDADQSRMSKLWSGPKAYVIIGHPCVEQKHQDILAAINRLSPYPVKDMNEWRAAMV